MLELRQDPQILKVDCFVKVLGRAGNHNKQKTRTRAIMILLWIVRVAISPGCNLQLLT